ncbi:undecaprenyl-diphosphate phosphatase [Flavonifractor plautii]|nr:undecaprenyl-diphosphate phosphatase [Flavonifractor plautii]
MTYFMSILMGIIQGVAEFLPISSSGHLALFQTFFGMENMEEKYMFFTVLLHFGTLISVCMVYWRDIVDMIREFFLGIAALAGRKDTGVARRLPDGW